MFELESSGPDNVAIVTKNTKVNFDVREGEISAGLSVGNIRGAGEFEIGEVTIRGIGTPSGKTIYDAEVGGVHVGIIGDIEESLDELGVSDILCTTSVRAIREIEPKMVVSMGNVDAMVSELKYTARTEKKLKIKNAESIVASKEVVILT